MMISGVLMVVGKEAIDSSRLSPCVLRISARRPAAYMPSSKPYQRSPKNIWPENSPPSRAPVSVIFSFMKACPVFHRTGRPPWRVIRSVRLRAALHVEHHVRPRVAGYHVLGVDHQQHIGAHDLAAGGDHREPVAIAVEGHAEIRFLLLHHAGRSTRLSSLLVSGG